MKFNQEPIESFENRRCQCVFVTVFDIPSKCVLNRKISITPDTKVLYNKCWMHEITKYPDREVRIEFLELSMNSKDDEHRV